MRSSGLALIASVAFASTSSAAGLKGIAPSLGGNYYFGEINESTAQFTPLATLPLGGINAVNQMTYFPDADKYVITAFLDFNTAYLITIDPYDYSMQAPFVPVPTSFVEGLEYSPALGGLVIAFGSNNFSNSLLLVNGFWQQMAIKTLATSNLDMDTLFVSGAEASLNKLDVNNSWQGHHRHIINNPFGTHSYTWTGADYWNLNHTDLAWHPTVGMNYVTQGSSLAVVHSLVNPPAVIGNYGGGYNVTALAYGPSPRTVQGTVILDDTVGSFPGTPRLISYQVVHNANVIHSGTMFMTTNSQWFQWQVSDNYNGPAEVVFNGSSFLRRKVPVNLSGPIVLTGPVNLQNGDPDFSGEVDAADIDLVIARFGNTYPSASPNPDADVDCTGEVDAADIDVVIANFGGVDD
ncbi:MAG: hypothetical protein JNK63_00095 [Chthonomonas sp.]|nr:hypothetical protein [Chthonomonas sp.]